MAGEDDRKRIKQKRAEEDEMARARAEKISRGIGLDTEVPALEASELTTEKLDDMMRRAEVMIEVVGGLYNSYIRGFEVQSPIVRRQQLETLMSNLTNFPKPTPVYRFKFYSILSTFTQHRERWDKMMKDLEDGKIKRVVRPRSSRRAG